MFVHIFSPLTRISSHTHTYMFIFAVLPVVHDVPDGNGHRAVVRQSSLFPSKQRPPAVARLREREADLLQAKI